MVAFMDWWTSEVTFAPESCVPVHVDPRPPHADLGRALDAALPGGADTTPKMRRALACSWLRAVRRLHGDPTLRLVPVDGPFAAGWTLISSRTTRPYPTTGSLWLTLLVAAETASPKAAA